MNKTSFDVLGLQSYRPTWEKQLQLFQDALTEKKEGVSPKNHLLLCEHKPVFTLGKSASFNHVLLHQKDLGAEVIRIERGGDVTFHGPGQLVGYPILDLVQYNIGLRTYIEQLEEVIIRVLAEYDIEGGRVHTAAGVWLDVGMSTERKICALGVKASRHITMHGFALNVNTDLTWFDKIIPCGIPGKGVTSLAKELGHEQDMSEVILLLKKHFVQVFEP